MASARRWTRPEDVRALVEKEWCVRTPAGCSRTRPDSARWRQSHRTDLVPSAAATARPRRRRAWCPVRRCSPVGGPARVGTRLPRRDAGADVTGLGSPDPAGGGGSRHRRGRPSPDRTIPRRSRLRSARRDDPPPSPVVRGDAPVAHARHQQRVGRRPRRGGLDAPEPEPGSLRAPGGSAGRPHQGRRAAPSHDRRPGRRGSPTVTHEHPAGVRERLRLSKPPGARSLPRPRPNRRHL